MILQPIRRTAAALALAATLALAAPAHAAGWRDLAGSPGWIGSALEWIAQLWVGSSEAAGFSPVFGNEKEGMGVDPSGGSGVTSSPQPPPASSTGGDEG
ncbi:MAG TPA: hypothetical protein VGX68_16280 [Thermoanaerobaculia bacterium]|jgi:hypothetical protein|nr:hypothetical protein [Thermoanaerobaculia bacterium]